MKPSELIQSLTGIAIPLRKPAIVAGPPGVGKSQIVQQAAKACGYSYVDVRAAYFDPVDVRGFPLPNEAEGYVRWLMPRFLHDAREQAPAVLGFDELPNAPVAVQNVLYQLFLDRRIDEHLLPDDCALLAMGNRAEDRSGAFRLSTALANRLLHYDFEVDLNDWCAWALQNGVPPELVAFLRYRPDLLHAFDPKAKEMAFPSPRMWGEFVGPMLASGRLGNGTELSNIAAAVGRGAATELVGFLRVWRQLPSPDAVLLDPRNANVPSDPAVRFAMAGALARRATDANFGAVITYAERMDSAFATLTVRDAIARDPELQNTHAFIEWTARNPL